MGCHGERARSSAAKTGGEDGDGEARAGCWWPGQSMRGATEPRVGTGTPAPGTGDQAWEEHRYLCTLISNLHRHSWSEGALVTQLHTDVASQASYSLWPEQADARTLSLQRVPWARVAAGTHVPKRCPPQRSHHTAELPTRRRSRDKLPSQGRGHPC